MGVGNTLLIAQLTAFILSFILSFFIFVPMSFNMRDFDGNCLLYATGTWDTNTSQLVAVDWGPSSACHFSIFIGVAIMLLTLFYLILNIIYVAKNTDSSWLETFISTSVCLLFSLMLFASSTSVSVGLKKWCNLITSPQSQIVSCELADFIPFDKKLADIDTSNFYTEMKITEFGSWSSFICWIFLLAISVIKVIKFQRHETFMASVTRERQRLLQRVGKRTEYSV